MLSADSIGQNGQHQHVVLFPATCPRWNSSITKHNFSSNKPTQDGRNPSDNLFVSICILGLTFPEKISNFTKMGLSDEGDESVHQKFEDICLDLNMDTTTKHNAWINYNKILTNYSLEVKNQDRAKVD